MGGGGGTLDRFNKLLGGKGKLFIHCIGCKLARSSEKYEKYIIISLSNACSAVNGCRQNESPSS